MSDSMFDADRAAGLYPPKGYGWLDTANQKIMVAALIKRGDRDQWLLDEAKFFGIKVDE